MSTPWRTLPEAAREALRRIRAGLDPEARRRARENRAALHREVEALLERGDISETDPRRGGRD